MHRHFRGAGARHSRHPFAHGYRQARRGRLGRMLEHGDLRHVMLALLADRPRHGYELMRELEDRTGGAYRPSPGVVYPTLAMLEDEGLIRQAGGESGRKLFELTDTGRESLERNRPAVEAIFGRMGEAAAASALSSPKVLRALENLKTALRLRLSAGPVTGGQIEAIAAALDEAAGKVERA